MADGYRISKTAARQLAEIVDFTDQAFGVLQTDAYIAGLKHSFELIAEFPGAGVAAFEIKQGWRRHRFQSHYIFYSSLSGQVLIEAIVHVRRSLRPDLFES